MEVANGGTLLSQSRNNGNFMKKIVLAFFLGCFPSISKALLCPSMQSPTMQRVLVIIGYTDAPETFWQKVGVSDYPYIYSAKDYIQSQLKIIFESKEFRQLSNIDLQVDKFLSCWVNTHKSMQIDVVDPNSTCANAKKMNSMFETRSPWDCESQTNISRQATSYVFNNLFQYDAAVYLGHARYGSGLGLGDFNDIGSKVNLSELSMNAIAQLEQVKLKLIVMLSCNSWIYYRNVFNSLGESYSPKFIGVSDREISFAQLIDTNLPKILIPILDYGIIQFTSIFPQKTRL